jgi:uncharacterized repeat protein (TIGR03803 family)
MEQECRTRGNPIRSLRAILIGVSVLSMGLSHAQAQLLPARPIQLAPAPAPTAPAPPSPPPYTLIHNFDCTLYANGLAPDGCSPDGPGYLAEGRDGSLYGTVPTGGNLVSPRYDGGTIFNIGAVAPFPFTVLYTLGFSATDGTTSHSGLTLGMDGFFYGTAEFGGAPSNGKGSVFRFGGNGFATFSPAFTGGVDGGFPWAPPIEAPDGNLYGVTNGGNSKGVIYRCSPASATCTSPLYTFGVNVSAALVFGFDGYLYGTTQAGSATAQNGFSPIGGGTVFRIPLAASGTVQPTFLHNFDATATVPSASGVAVPDGSVPKGPVVFGSDGNLYGTTSGGGSGNQGVIYQLNPSTGAYKVLHAFSTYTTTFTANQKQFTALVSEGSGSESGLVQGADGFLYGVARTGGPLGGSLGGFVPVCTYSPNTGCGTLFKLDTSGNNFAVIHSFGQAVHCSPTLTADDGSFPVSTPTLHTNGKIYGMVARGGCRVDYGGIYSFDAGLHPFVSIVGGSRWVNAGTRIGVIGQGFNSATGVFLGNSTTPLGKLAVQIFSDTYMEISVPQLLGKTHVVVQLPGASLTSPEFICTPPPRGLVSLCR